jgi:hypothetical protein
VGQADDQARFAAREFFARWKRETEESPSAALTDHMLLAYEVGYLHGRGDGMLAAIALYDETRRKVIDESE